MFAPPIPGTSWTYRSLIPADGRGIEVLLQRTGDDKHHKNRLHLDLRTADLEREVERILGLGASLLTGGTRYRRDRRVEQRRQVTRMRLPLVSFRYTYTFLHDGAVATSESTLRFRRRDEVEASLAAGGYRVLEVREALGRPGREYVFIAKRTT